MRTFDGVVSFQIGLLVGRDMADVDVDVGKRLLGSAFSLQISLMGAGGARSRCAAGERRGFRSFGDWSDREVEGAYAVGRSWPADGDDAWTLQRAGDLRRQAWPCRCVKPLG